MKWKSEIFKRYLLLLVLVSKSASDLCVLGIWNVELVSKLCPFVCVSSTPVVADTRYFWSVVMHISNVVVDHWWLFIVCRSSAGDFWWFVAGKETRRNGKFSKILDSLISIDYWCIRFCLMDHNHVNHILYR